MHLFLFRHGRAGHYRLTGEPLQQAACAVAPSLQNILREGSCNRSSFMGRASSHKSLIPDNKPGALVHRSLSVTVDADDKQGAAAGAAGEIKKGLDVP